VCDLQTKINFKKLDIYLKFLTSPFIIHWIDWFLNQLVKWMFISAGSYILSVKNFERYDALNLSQRERRVFIWATQSGLKNSACWIDHKLRYVGFLTKYVHNLVVK
jgi:hypothetical protein